MHGMHKASKHKSSSRLPVELIDQLDHGAHAPPAIADQHCPSVRTASRMGEAHCAADSAFLHSSLDACCACPPRLVKRCVWRGRAIGWVGDGTTARPGRVSIGMNVGILPHHAYAERAAIRHRCHHTHAPWSPRQEYSTWSCNPEGVRSGGWAMVQPLGRGACRTA